MQLVVQLRSLSTNRALSALVGASALSAFGDWLYLAALPIIVYQATHDAALVGLAAAGRLIPFFVLSMPAGLLADRCNRRRILIVSESARCALMLVTASLYVAGADVAVLIGVGTLSAAFGTFSMPAQNALIPNLARTDAELGMANACSATLDNIASIFGPIAAGILVVTAGLGVACAINGISFAVVVLLIVWSRPPAVAAIAVSAEHGPVAIPETGTANWASIGGRAARAIVMDAAISFAAGALGVLPVLIAVEQLGAGEAFSGVLGAGAGAGAVLGGLAAGAMINGAPSRALGLGTLVAFGSIVLLASTSLPIVAVIASAGALGSLVMLDTLNITNLQRTVPGPYLGRAFGLLHTSAAVWLMAGSALPSLLASAMGVPAALLMTAMVVITLGGLSLLRAPLRERPIEFPRGNRVAT